MTIGINIPSEDNSINYLQDFRAEETLNFNYQKFRNESSDDLSEKIKQSLESMIENKTLNATLAWGGDNYFLSIEKSILNSDTMNCYSGTIFNEGNSSKFSFCQNQNDSIFSYITDN